MTTSSAPEDYLTTSSEIFTIDVSSLSSISSDTITISGGTGYSYTSVGGTYYNTSIGSLSTASISPITVSDINTWIMPEEWVGRFPEWSRIEKMCEAYPGLKIAFEKFKTTYYLVKDEYDNPETKK